jgi:hypothetical protein
MTEDAASEHPYHRLQIPWCRACERAMALLRSIARQGHLPRLDTWHCAGCSRTETVECRLS